MCTNGTCGLNCTEDVFASNNTPSTAATLTLVEGLFQADLALCGVYAQDVFQFTLDVSGPLLVTIEHEPTTGELVLGLVRKSDGMAVNGVLQKNGDRGGVFFDLEADTYVLSIFNDTSMSQADPAVSYALTLSAHAPECVASGDCQLDADCAAGSFCVEQHCLATTCSTDATCLQDGTGTRCDLTNGYCVNGLEASDCGSVGYKCIGGRCDVDCTEDAFEPNAAVATAAEISLPFTAAGLTLCGLVDEDWFGVPLVCNTHYLFELQAGLGGPPPMSMQLYHVGPNGEPTIAGYIMPSPAGLMLDFTTGPNQSVWLVRVFNVGPEPAPTYNLSIHAVP